MVPWSPPEISVEMDTETCGRGPLSQKPYLEVRVPYNIYSEIFEKHDKINFFSKILIGCGMKLLLHLFKKVKKNLFFMFFEISWLGVVATSPQLESFGKNWFFLCFSKCLDWVWQGDSYCLLHRVGKFWKKKLIFSCFSKFSD